MRVIRSHSDGQCAGEYCTIHNPSPEAIEVGRQYWRDDRGIMERICSHGIGHYDFDQWAYHHSLGQKYQAVHGCDGCCADHWKARTQ